MQATPTRIFLVLFVHTLICALICPPSVFAYRVQPQPETNKEAPVTPDARKPDAARESSGSRPARIACRPERRTALVIGNSAYNAGPLKNPVNDAADMAMALQQTGFTVILKKNAGIQEMEDAIEDFGNRLKRGGVGFFYFAGHGVQVNGVNYLVPIGARINKETDVKYQAVDANKILDEMATANNGLNIVILDACRDNPFARSFRNAARGLAIVSSAPSGTFISYSTSPGNVARDGEGRNSPFTTALLENIKMPGLPIEQVFKRVRQKLDASTGGRQVPWELSSIKGDFYFNPSAKQDIAAIRTPVASDPLLRQAQIAYEAGHFTEPEGDNTVELARQALRNEPDNRTAGDLIARAASAYENQAKLALARDDRSAALKIYQRLFQLFPDQETYLKQTIALEKPAVPEIVGVWNWSVRSPFVPDRINTIRADGTCTLSNLTGTWIFQKNDENTVVFYWSDNWMHTMTVSKDGQSMTGSDDWGTKVTGRKIK